METRTNDVLKALNGDNAAMERLYNETYPKLRAVTVSILKNEDDAEDIIQDTYIKAFSTLKQLDDISKFDAWLCRIASNKCKDYLKKHKPVLFADMGGGDEDEDPYEWSIEDESGAYNPEEVAISDDTRRQLMELINSLPDEQRICLVYYAVEEMKISEIAQMMEVSESTVKSRLKYAKEKMRTKIEELEKKGVKIRSVSGFALIPFLHFLFATEAKAATAISFSAISEAVATVAKASSTATTTSASTVAKTVVTEVAKQTGTKAAVGLGAKIASLPLIAKIAAGVIAVGVAVGVPVIINKEMTTAKYEDNAVEYYSVNDQKAAIESTSIPAEIEEAINAHFQVAICGLGKDNWYKLYDSHTNGYKYTLDDLVEDNEELLLKAAPESEWLSFPWSREGKSWKESAANFIGMFYDYKMPSFNYNAGIDFELSYKIIQHKETNEGYDVSVKYILTGSDGTFSTTEIYNVVNLDGVWYAKTGDNYGIYWDNALQNELSKSWQPGNSVPDEPIEEKKEIPHSNIVECDFCDETREGETRIVFDEQTSMCYICMEELEDLFVE